jgi:predicted nuclease with TOPRIM domain
LAHEQLIKKYNEERNELIKEGNKSNDSKYNELKAQYDSIKEANKALEEKIVKTVEEMTAK